MSDDPMTGVRSGQGVRSTNPESGTTSGGRAQSLASSQRRCPNCGKENAIDGRFCLHCGQEMAPVPPPQPAREVSAGRSVAFQPVQPVIVTDINMSFGSMVVFMIKWALASIPALIILAIMLAFVTAILSGILGGVMYNLF